MNYNSVPGPNRYRPMPGGARPVQGPTAPARRVVVPRPVLPSRPLSPLASDCRVGICMRCGEEFQGPYAVRLMHGRIEYPKETPNEPAFKALKFSDNQRLKWLCPPCAAESSIIQDACCFRPHSMLDHLATGWCCLCHQPIQPFPLKNWGSALSIDLGRMAVNSKSGAEQFYPFEDQGYRGQVDWRCTIVDLGLDLNNLIDPEDAPDPDDYQPEPDEEYAPEYEGCEGCGQCEFCRFLMETGDFENFFEELISEAGEG